MNLIHPPTRDASITRPDGADVLQLLTLLGRWQAQLAGLLQIADDKLAAMKRADADALTACAQREEALLRGVGAGEQERHELLARLAQALPGGPSRIARLSDLAGILPEPLASQILAKNAGLRQAALKLREKNRLAAGVARHLQLHIRGVFAEVAKAGQESIVYGPQGRHEQRNRLSFVDAVG
ncbi:FlgN protein [Phycisphaerae bacterium RAS1]|nr:FlgN protein [Phycisphaerae bacterium RAS1]